MNLYTVIFITGVSGSGKTTIGKLLAQKTGYAFYDADDFHPLKNIAKMKAGQPLTDEDRQPWLQSLHQFIAEKIISENIIVACSALKEAYRKQLAAGIEDNCRWVFLNGDYSLIQQRLLQRKEHYMPATLLQSQFTALEKPAGAIEIDIENSPAVIVNSIIAVIQ